MEASIKGDNIKNFVRLLQCAARYGDELCMHVNKETWELAVTNSSKSAYSLVTLQPAFFSKYRPLGSAAEQRRGIKCQLYVKSIISVLGKASAVKEVERLDLKIHDPDAGLRAPADDEDEDDDIRVNQRSAQLELKLVYNHGITKKHFLHLQASEFLRAVVDPDSTPSGFQISAKTLRDWFDHFTLAFTAPASNTSANVRGDTQLAWMLSQDEVRVKNLNGLAMNSLSTEITLDVAEFTNYEVVGGNGRVDLTLPMKEFKATLQLAEQFGMDLDFFFSEATQPMTISSICYGADKFGNDKQLFTLFFVVATSSCDAFASVTSTPSNGSSAKRKRESESVSVKTDVDAHGRMPSARPRPSSSRPRTSLSLTVEAPDRGPSQVSLMGANGLASQRSQRELREQREPLFLPGPSQASQRMSQQEALEAAGMDDVDLEAVMEDADADTDDDLGRGDEEDHVPTDWGDVGEATFDAGLHAAQMSTPREVARAVESQTLRAPSQRVPSPVRPAPDQLQRRSTSPVKPPPLQRRSASPTKAGAVVENPAPPATRGRSEAPSRDRSASASRSRSRPRSDEDLGDDDDVPALGPTQGVTSNSSGHQFRSFFDDD